MTEAARITPDEAVTALAEAAFTHTPGLEDAAESLLAAVRVALGQHEPNEKGNCPLCSQAARTSVPAPCPRAAAISGAAGELPQSRAIIHCFLGGMGADWDLDDAVRLVREAEKVGWAPSVFRHELAALKGGKLYRFDARAPEGLR